MVKQSKIDWVEEFSQQLRETPDLIFTDFKGLNVHEMEDLRHELYEQDSRYKVVKNELAERAFNQVFEDDQRTSEALMDRVEEFLTGNTAIAFSGNGFVGVAKAVLEFAEDHEHLRVKGGILDGEVLDLERVEYISGLPPRRELLTRLARGLNQPIQRLAVGLADPLNKLVNVLSQVQEQKEQSS